MTKLFQIYSLEPRILFDFDSFYFRFQYPSFYLKHLSIFLSFLLFSFLPTKHIRIQKKFNNNPFFLVFCGYHFYKFYCIFVSFVIRTSCKLRFIIHYIKISIIMFILEKKTTKQLCGNKIRKNLRISIYFRGLRKLKNNIFCIRQSTLSEQCKAISLQIALNNINTSTGKSIIW